MFPTCHKSVLRYVVVHCHEEKILYVASFGILAFFHAANGSSWLIVVGYMYQLSPQVLTAHSMYRVCSVNIGTGSLYTQWSGVEGLTGQLSRGLPHHSVALYLSYLWACIETGGGFL